LSPIAPAGKRIVSREQAAAHAAAWRAAGERVVLANGVFDLLHVGHVRYLQEARALGERLIVAVNGDASVAGKKGPGRPVLMARDRASLVASLRGVDLVVLFDDPTVDALLRELRPNVHAKGTDYRADTVPERATASEVGAQTAITGDAKNHASRELVERVRALHPGGA
jgi:rfaE bifunctional protein nucleotidyltransferase chain/domain